MYLSDRAVVARAIGTLLLVSTATMALPNTGGTALANAVRDDWVRQTEVQDARLPLTTADDAAGGCDGIKDGSAGFHTEKQQDPWWQVDLGSAMPLSRIVVWNRTTDDGATARSRRLVVLISPDGRAWEEIYRHAGAPFHGMAGGPPLTVPVGDKAARYVQVGLADNEYFHLDEVEVFGTADPQTNLALDQPATQSSTSAWSTPRRKPAVGTEPDRFRRAAREAVTLATATRALLPESERIAAYDRALADLRTRLEDAVTETEFRELFLAVRTLRRDLLLSHPALDFDRLLINKRPPPRAHAHMCEQYLGRHSAAGPGLVILDSWKDTPRETVLLDGELPEGSVLHPDLSFDAERVIFSFCDHAPTVDDDVRLPIHPTEIGCGYHNQETGARRFSIYEATLDGKHVRQLTGTASDPMTTAHDRATVQIEDLDPCYLPDGGFVFSSTRSQSFGRCHGGVYKPAFLLYRANADGSGIRQMSFGEANEWDPSILPDGRIIYTRWDYINRHNTWFQSLWVTRPDGTATAHYYGNYTRNPCVIAESHAIPGSGKIVATAGAHHFITGGSIILVDPRKGQDGPDPLTRITPEVKFPETEGWGGDGCFASPYPLSDDLFLAAYSPEPINYGVRPSDAAFAIYLVDSLGGRELIYRDPAVSCFTPIPIRPRPVPPVIPSNLASAGATPATGTCYVQNVYQSTQSLPKGSIKYLRINRIHEQPTANFALRSRAVEEVVKSVIGTVPVADDGSVAFSVPANLPLQLQALDENRMALMTMRSVLYAQPGEVVSCVGCHESRASASPVTGYVISEAAASTPVPLPGPQYDGGFSFMRTVQPVLDRYCIGCHGLNPDPAAGLNLIGDQAYASLTERPGLVAIALSNVETTTSSPKEYFAHAGRLAGILLKGTMGQDHVTIPGDDLERILTWLDLNAQHFGDYSFNRLEERTADPEGEKRLRAAVRERLGEAFAERPWAALVNVGQADYSPILKAPMAINAGGWGQVSDPGWTSEQDPEFQRFRQLVADAISPLKTTDRQGTCGQHPCVCGSCWVRELAQRRGPAARTE